MKEEEIKELFEQFEAIANEYEGVECWSARELAQVLGYSKWERFEGVIERAKDACINAGEMVEYHFPGVGKMIPLAKGAQREVKDYMLTRYACYLIAWNTNVYKHVQNLQKQRSVSLVCCMKEGWTAKALPSFAH